MMRYNFDEVIDRRHTDSVKWNGAYNDDPEMIKMWVADMDFRILPEITAALKHRIEEGIFGYGMIPDSYYQAVVNYMARRHHFTIEKDWITLMPGVVSAIKLCINALTQKDDAILIMPPVYYPFKDSIIAGKRQCICCPLSYVDDHYELDLEAFEQAIISHDVKMLIFCNPHNPIGKVWTRAEIEAIGRICQKHHVLVLSDEIHMDFVYQPHVHVPFYNVDESFKAFTIIATSASKTFNLAGLQCSNIIIADPDLRKQFQAAQNAMGFYSLNVLAPIATQTAYEAGDAWVDEMLIYVEGNIRFMQDYLQKYIPRLKMADPQGLYLVWVDCRDLNLTAKEQELFMLQKAHLWLDEGLMFGAEGAGFERFNLACPRATLKQALDQLRAAVDTL